MKSKVKKIASALLIVCMLVMLIPNSVIALEEDNAAAVPGVSVLTENDIPENLDLQTVLERNHIERLYGQETEMNSVTFKNQDGTATVYLFDEAIKYVDAAGNVKDKSNKLTKVTGGYTNVKNDINVLYPDNIANGVTVTYGEYSVKLVHMPQSNGNQMSANAVAELVSVINKQTPDKMIYDGVYGSNTYVEYIQNFNGFKENIIVESAGGQTSFSYLLYTGGLTPVEEAGTLVLVDGENNEICTLGALYIYDSNGNEGYGEYEVVEIKEGQIYGVTIVADDFFALPDIAYPVTVDPTVRFECESDELFKDTSIYVGHTTPEYAFQWLHVGTHSTRGKSRSLIAIKDENVINKLVTMYNRELITSIKLNMVCTLNTGTPVNVNAHLITSMWDEDVTYDSAIWNNYNSTVLTTVGIPANITSEEIELEIKDAFLNSITPLKGIMLKLPDETHPLLAIASSDCGSNGVGLLRNRPYISYTHILPTGEVSGITSGAEYQIKTSTGTLAISYPEYDSSNMMLAAPNAALSANQRFVISHIGSGKYGITTIDGGEPSGFMLGVSNGNLSVESPAGEDYQYWYIVPKDNGYVIVNAAFTEYCISRDEALVEATNDQWDNIIWIFSAV